MKFENTEVFNFEGALRGLRNPKDSWSLSDSHYIYDVDKPFYEIGKNDLSLAQKMIKGGSTHSKYLRQIFVSVDITAPRYWWSEFDTYKIGTTANSSSTMHKLTAYPMNREMFEFNGIKELVEDGTDDNNLNLIINEWWENTIELLEKIRTKSQETKHFKYKRIMKQMLPEGFFQKRTVTLNYASIRHMVASRSHHQLTEWNTDFINWAKNLPYTNELIFYELKYE